MKKFQFAFLICVPLIWFFFKLLPVYTHPLASATDNFIYAENLELLNRWCFDATKSFHFDDSSNFLYVFSLWLLIHFFKFTTIKAALAISAFSLMMSVYLLHKIIDSRFTSVQLLLVGLLFMSTQIWAGFLGDEILFQGMLWLFAIRAFWKHSYVFLLFWSVVNIITRPDNILVVLPLIIASYVDIRALKDRDKPKFVSRRIRRTITFFVLPLIGYFTYRYLYFGKILPYASFHHNLDQDKKFGIFNFDAFNFLKHYLRYYTLPLLIGVVFYFLKERKKLSARYYALAFSLLIIPAFYVCTFSQNENIGFKNYYIIYLGLIIFPLLFIRDFRSITQGITTAIFVVFFGIKMSFVYFQHSLQSYNNNSYYIVNDLSQIRSGKAIVYYDNFIPWLTEWKTIFANGKHTKDGDEMTRGELMNSSADIIVTEKKEDIELLKVKYVVYSVPKNTRQYEKDQKPENSLDLFFYKYAHKLKIDMHDNFSMLVLKNGKNFKMINEIILKYGAKQID